MKKEHEILFEPFKIGTVMIKNRFVLEPMEGTNMICQPGFSDFTVSSHFQHASLYSISFWRAVRFRLRGTAISIVA